MRLVSVMTTREEYGGSIGQAGQVTNQHDPTLMPDRSSAHVSSSGQCLLLEGYIVKCCVERRQDYHTFLPVG